MEVGDDPGVTFAGQLDLSPSVDGRYKVDVSADWNCPVVPQGGVMAALAARAMALELGDDELRLRTLTTVFAAQVAAGPVEVDVTVLRRGRSMSQVRADIRSHGADAGHTSVAVFGRARPGFEFTDATMPDVPPPDECPSWRDRSLGDLHPDRPPFPFWDKVEGRAALGHAPWDDWVPASSECASWFRFDDPPRLADGTLDPLAALTLCDTMPGSVGERMGPGTPFWLPPSADLTVHLFGDARSEWLLAHYRTHRAGDGYVSVAADLWDPDPAVGLVAHATQVMFLVFPNGPPLGDDRYPADRRQGRRQGDA